MKHHRSPLGLGMKTAIAAVMGAVQEVSLRIPRGVLVLVKEPSGSGKTTLLNLLAGLDEPTDQLDTLTGASIITLLKEVTTQTGVTVVIAGHGPNVEQVADVIYQLQDGRLVGKLERRNPSFVSGRSPSIARRPSRSSGPGGVT